MRLWGVGSDCKGEWCVTGRRSSASEVDGQGASKSELEESIKALSGVGKHQRYAPYACHVNHMQAQLRACCINALVGRPMHYAAWVGSREDSMLWT